MKSGADGGVRRRDRWRPTPRSQPVVALAADGGA